MIVTDRGEGKVVMVEAEAAAVGAQSTADGLVPLGVRKFVKWWTLWEMPDMTRQRPLGSSGPAAD